MSDETTAGQKILAGAREAVRAVTLRNAVYELDGFEMTIQEAIEVLAKVDAAGESA